MIENYILIILYQNYINKKLIKKIICIILINNYVLFFINIFKNFY